MPHYFLCAVQWLMNMQVMVALVLLDSNEVNLPFCNSSSTSGLFRPAVGRSFRTQGVSLLVHDGVDPAPDLDTGLKELIAVCMAQRYQFRPSLGSLADRISEAIRIRDAAWYADPDNGHPNPGIETDEAIHRLVQACLQNPPAIDYASSGLE